MAFAGVIGPIVERELRILCRRRRHYVLRFGYCVLLMGVIAAAWLVGMNALTQRPDEALNLHVSARMGVVSEQVVRTLLWCQFAGAQLLAICFVSDALTEERTRGTLEVLLATPLRAGDILVGKLLARILPILLLLALNLPLLGIVRLWGGVPWSLVLTATLITLSAVLLVAALTLWGSLWMRHSHQVTVAMLVSLATLYMLSRLINSQLTAFPGWLCQGVLLLNPISMYFQTRSQLQVPATAGPQFLWLYHFFAVSLLALLLLGLQSMMLHRSALGRSGRRFFRGLEGPIRHVTGSCVLWLKLRRSVLRQMLSQTGLCLLIAIPLALLVRNCWGKGPTGLSFTLWSGLHTELWIVLSLTTVASAALAISQEKDRRAWSLLLATPLTNGRILRDLTSSLFLKHGAAWLTLLASDVLLVWVFYRPNDLSDTFMVVSQFIFGLLEVPSYFIFLLGAGMYVGLRSNGATTAVMTATGLLVCRYVVEKQICMPVAFYALGAQRTSLVLYQGAILGLNLVLGAALLQRTGATLRRHCLRG